MTGVSNALRSLAVTYRGKSSRACTQTMSLLRWTDGAWVQVDSRYRRRGGERGRARWSGALGDYVSGTAGDGEVRVRVRCTTTAGSFYLSGDRLAVTFTK